jgi:predicted transposase YbfD/YdcC
LTQRDIAQYIVGKRDAHYHFTVKGNQPNLLKDIELYFENRQHPDFVEDSSLEHGRIETRKIWTTSELNDYLDFPHIGQAFVIERWVEHKKSGKKTMELAYGVTSRTPDMANAKRVLAVNRGHWCIENKCHYILDKTFDEDRSRIRTGYGPENVTRLRRFAIGTILSKGVKNVAKKMRQLTRNVRLVFDYLGMTQNSRPSALRI